ncbi:hypothetical protein [Micromonospora matsumotoense]
MTALDAVAVYLPPRLVPVEKLADRLELTDIQVKNADTPGTTTRD